eukprot:2887479-Rhodomonas_salina.1
MPSPPRSFNVGQQHRRWPCDVTDEKLAHHSLPAVSAWSTHRSAPRQNPTRRTFIARRAFSPSV